MSKENKGFDEKKAYKRDTIAMVSVLVLLFLAPVGITLYENYKSNNASSDLQIETNIDGETLDEVAKVTPSDAPKADLSEEQSEADAEAEQTEAEQTDAPKAQAEQESEEE